MGKYEVTRRQWQAVMKKMRRSSQRVLDDPDSPVVHVSWNDAKSFAEALNAHVKSTGQGNGTFRLPSEAEWEYACRAGTTTDFYWGNDENYDYVKRGNTTISYFRGVDHNHQFAWWYKNTWEANEKYAHKVGQKLPNAWGLYDMIGNASEWCEDLWHIDYTNAPDDGSAWLTDPIARDYLYRVYRGGSWQSEGKELYLHNRSQGHPGYFDNDLGFRIARDLQ